MQGVNITVLLGLFVCLPLRSEIWHRVVIEGLSFGERQAWNQIVGSSIMNCVTFGLLHELSGL